MERIWLTTRQPNKSSTIAEVVAAMRAKGLDAALQHTNRERQLFLFLQCSVSGNTHLAPMPQTWDSYFGVQCSRARSPSSFGPSADSRHVLNEQKSQLASVSLRKTVSDTLGSDRVLGK